MQNRLNGNAGTSKVTGKAGIYIGLGGNLPDAAGHPPAEAFARAIRALANGGVETVARSHLYSAAPIPASDQPRYTNAVVEVATSLAPDELMRLLLEIEFENARSRAEKGAARTLDLDLLDYRGEVRLPGAEDEPPLNLPHPRLHRRRFVLAPLAEIAPRWRHPVTGETVFALLADPRVAAQDVIQTKKLKT